MAGNHGWSKQSIKSSEPTDETVSRWTTHKSGNRTKQKIRVSGRNGMASGTRGTTGTTTRRGAGAAGARRRPGELSLETADADDAQIPI